MDAAYEKALKEREAMKELAAEAQNLLTRIDALNISELAFLGDEFVDYIIAIGREVEVGDLHRSSQVEMLNTFFDYSKGVTAHIVMVHGGNENVNHESTTSL